MRLNRRFNKKASSPKELISTNPQTFEQSSPHPGVSNSTSFTQITQLIQIYQSQSKDPEALLTQILRVVKGYFSAEEIYLWKSSHDKSQAQCVKAIGRGAQISRTSISLTQAPYSKLVSQDEFFITDEQIFLALKYNGEFFGFIEIKHSNPSLDNPTTQIKNFDLSKELLCTFLHTNDSYAHQTKLNERINILYDLHQEFADTMDLDILLKKILNRSIDLLGADVGSIWLKSEQSDSIQCHIAHGPTKSKVEGMSVESGVGIIGWVVENNKPSIISDCADDSRFASSVDEKTNYKTKSMISAPLAVKGECLGSIQIINKKSEELFNQMDLDFLSLIASESAMYIKNSRLFASEKHAKELKALINISKEVSSTLDFDSVLMSIANLSSDIINYDTAVLSSFRPESNSISIRAISGVQAVDQEDPEVLLYKSLHEKILKSDQEITIKNSDEVAAYAKDLPLLVSYFKDRELQSFWAYAMKDDQGPLGVMTMESTNKNMVQAEDKEMMSILLSQSTISMRNAQLYNTIPSGKVLSHLKDNFLHAMTHIRDWSPKKKMGLVGGFIFTILALVFIKLPNQITTNIEVLAISQIHYAESTGRIESIHVSSGQAVLQNDLLIKIDDSDLLIELAQKKSSRQKAIYEMIKMQLDDRIADYKIKESEVLSLNYEINLVQKKLAGTNILANSNGLVITEKLHELVGMPVSFGQELIAIADTDRVHIKFDIPEEDAPFVKTGQSVKFKLFSYPTVEFDKNIQLKTMAAEGRQLTEQAKQRYFVATSDILTKDYSSTPLRSGMTGRGKIATPPRPLGLLIFEAPMRLILTELLW